MSIEQLIAKPVAKPWGVLHPAPWYLPANGKVEIGELWYERPNVAASPTALLLKLLFTSKPLSIQVHPDDAYARSIGLPNGKTEAWYVVDAAAGARVALGLRQRCSPQQLRQSIEDGSIADLVAWHPAAVGDVFAVPAGTIHAIGAGLVMAEIQQRSDATFRLFDYGRRRDLHIDRAVAAATTAAVEPRLPPIRLSDQRTLLVANRHFVLERLDLPAHSGWRVASARETWLLALNGWATTGTIVITAGGAILAASEQADVRVGPTPLVCLVAYSGEVARQLLRPLGRPLSTTRLRQSTS